MRRLAIACAAMAAAVSVLAAASPASATPYHLIRWQDTGFCQIWDQSIPTTALAGELRRRQRGTADLRRRVQLQDRPPQQRHLLVLSAPRSRTGQTRGNNAASALVLSGRNAIARQ
ncbi:hypothetical protein ACVWY2_008371 [Bradyrhizobium sp. JR6.1]